MPTLADARRIALALPGTTEAPHHGMPSFRVRGRILATVPDEGHLRIMLESDQATALAESDPDTFEELWWGKRIMGVTVDLASVNLAALSALLDDAWRRRAKQKGATRS